ncbi:Uncharacterised protein [uncultured archaeon]|nr:Uncharacterised protein [uncultured archaeon]
MPAEKPSAIKNNISPSTIGDIGDLGDVPALTAECLLLDEALENALAAEPKLLEPAKKMASHHVRLLFVRALAKKSKAVSAKTVKLIFSGLLLELEGLLHNHSLGKEEHKYRLLQEIIAIREKRLAAEADSDELHETSALMDSCIKMHEAYMRSALGKAFGEVERELRKVESGFSFE